MKLTHLFICCIISCAVNAKSIIRVFKGTISDFQITMNLEFEGRTVKGWYVYDNKSTQLKLEGICDSNSKIFLNESNFRGKKTGKFEGTLFEKDMNGVWINPKDRSTLSWNVSVLNELNSTEKIESEQINKLRPIFQNSKVKGFSKLALWVSIGLISCLIITSYYFITKRSKVITNTVYEKTIEIHHVNGSMENEIEESNRKGNLFEGYIASRFCFKKENFNLKDATSDKNYNGNFPASNSNPDLYFEFEIKSKNQKIEFAVECKFRSGFSPDFKRKMIFIDEQHKIDNYKNYSIENNVLVFLALGVGGSPSKPEHVYIIPIEKIDSTIIDKDLFFDYKIPDRDYFFFDYENKKIK